MSKKQIVAKRRLAFDAAEQAARPDPIVTYAAITRQDTVERTLRDLVTVVLAHDGFHVFGETWIRSLRFGYAFDYGKAIRLPRLRLPRLGEVYGEVYVVAKRWVVDPAKGVDAELDRLLVQAKAFRDRVGRMSSS